MPPHSVPLHCKEKHRRKRIERDLRVLYKPDGCFAYLWPFFWLLVVSLKSGARPRHDLVGVYPACRPSHSCGTAGNKILSAEELLQFVAFVRFRIKRGSSQKKNKKTENNQKTRGWQASTRTRCERFSSFARKLAPSSPLNQIRS